MTICGVLIEIKQDKVPEELRKRITDFCEIHNSEILIDISVSAVGMNSC
jgi:hypothetical protein